MIGLTIGHYKVTAKLGAGGMGEVYRAHDEQLGRDVAIKVLPASSFSDPSARAGLLREARSAASLNHPNICTIHEVGEADGQAYIAMELVEGQPLAASLAAGPIPTETVLHYGVQIADALAHAHERRIVHRDLKSANVAITPEGRIKVLDFGLAKRLTADAMNELTRSQASLTTPGAMVGTLAYMSPEQVRGEPADERSDIWALGVMLHELVIGERPFRGHTGVALGSAILNQSLSPLPARVPIALQGVIERCLEKEPSRRYQRAGELRAALEAIQSGAAGPQMAWYSRAARAKGRLLAVVALVLLAIVVSTNFRGLRDRILNRAGTPRIESLAVLPLANLAGSTEQEYFVDGVTDELIAQLSKLRSLRVISRTSVMRYKGARKPIAEIARELGVQAVLEGSVRRAGDQVRVSAQLINAETDSALWSDTYDRNVRDILVLQSEIARAIAGEIRVQLSPQDKSRLAAARAVDPEAYELYLRARHRWNQRTPESLRQGLDYFQQAIAKDPAYAAAWSGIADTYVTLFDYGLMPAEESTAQAARAAGKALELDENLAEAHASLAHIHLHDWKWQEAKKEFERAIELDSGYTLGYHWYALCLTAIGRVQEAAAAMEEAHRLDPLSTRISADLGMAYLAERQPEKAIAQETRTLDFAPESGTALWIRGMAYEQKSQYDQAIGDFQEALKRSPNNPNFVAALAHAYALSGRQSEARRLLNELKKNPEAQPFFLALVYTGIGEKSAALVELEKAYRERAGSVRYLKVEPRLDPLRAEPRFQEMLRRMNFPE